MKTNEKRIMAQEPPEGGCFAVAIGLLVMVFTGIMIITILQIFGVDIPFLR